LLLIKYLLRSKRAPVFDWYFEVIYNTPISSIRMWPSNPTGCIHLKTGMQNQFGFYRKALWLHYSWVDRWHRLESEKIPVGVKIDFLPEFLLCRNFESA